MSIQERAEDATKRVMEVIIHLDKNFTKEQLKSIEDDWWDYFYDLLNNQID